MRQTINILQHQIPIESLKVKLDCGILKKLAFVLEANFCVIILINYEQQIKAAFFRAKEEKSGK